MKKLLSFLLMFVFIFTACSRQEEALPVYKDYADKFSFDESAIVSKEEKVERNYLYITEYDREGRTMRQTQFIGPENTYPDVMPAIVSEYMYHADGSYTVRRNHYTPANLFQEIFVEHDSSGWAYKSVGFYTEDGHRLGSLKTREKTETGQLQTVISYFYDDSGVHTMSNVMESDKEGNPLKITGYDDGEMVTEGYYEYNDNGYVMTEYLYHKDAQYPKVVMRCDKFGHPVRQDNYDKHDNLVEYYLFSYKNMDENGNHQGVTTTLFDADGNLKETTP